MSVVLTLLVMGAIVVGLYYIIAGLAYLTRGPR